MKKKRQKSKKADQTSRRLARGRRESTSIKALEYPSHLRENLLIEELRQTVEKLKVFDSLGRALTSSLDLSEILKIVAERLGNLLDCRHMALITLNETAQECFFEFPSELKNFAFRLGKGILGQTIERGRGGLVVSPQRDSRFAAEIDTLLVQNPSSLITFPILSRGTVHGLLAFYTEEKQHPFSEEQFRQLESFSDYLAIAVENARNFKKVQELTVTDDLTKLYNSRYLHLVMERELTRSQRYKEEFSLVFLDVDNFKLVNDHHGHMIGSELLKELGDFLLGAIRTSDVAIRYGGDEFVLVLPRTSKADSLILTTRILEKLRGHHFLKAKHTNIRMTASFGIATFPEDGLTIDQIISAADKAMYVVKRGSKDGVLVANPKPVSLLGTHGVKSS